MTNNDRNDDDGPFVFTATDLRIIEALQHNARAPMVVLAKKLGMPTSSVRHRVQKLMKAGILEIIAMTNPLRMGYQIWAMLELQVELSKLNAAADLVAREPEVYFVGITTGRYDIYVSAVFRTNEDFLDFITKRLATIPGITRVSSSPMLRVVKRSMAYVFPREGGGHDDKPER